MAELKTQKNDGDVAAYLNSVSDVNKRADSLALKAMMEEITGEPATMWGKSIVGFGSYRYKYKSGREGEWFLVGFAPRKQSMTLYIMAGFDGYGALMSTLGKFTTGKSCLYIKRLSDVDESVLRQLIKESADHVAASR